LANVCDQRSGGKITIVSIARYDFISLAYPVYFFVCDGVIAILILTRRSALAKHQIGSEITPLLP
jgi:hypothetical protein